MRITWERAALPPMYIFFASFSSLAEGEVSKTQRTSHFPAKNFVDETLPVITTGTAAGTVTEGGLNVYTYPAMPQ